MRLQAWLCALAALLPLAAQGSSPTPKRVILISIDTLAADHMGVYGYFRDTTPFLYRFASENVAFESAYSQAPHTLASHFSIFTGVYPDTHGIAAELPQDRLLSPGLLTIAEYMKQAGYRTSWIGTVSDPNLNLARGLGRGFDRELPLDFGKEGDRKRLLGKELKELASGRSFLFLHTYQVHDPYCPPQPLDKVFDPSFTREVEDTCGMSGPLRRESFFQQFDLSRPADRQHLIALYDGGIRAVDDAVRELFDRLKELGLYDDALIVITSDHGETFGDRGYYLHREPSHEELHVPLLMKIPGQEPRRVRDPVLSIDILPTVLELAGISRRSPIQGTSLVPLLEGKPLREHPPGVARGLTLEAIWDQKWKYMTATSGGGGDQLYDLEVDPLERENEAALRPEIAAQKKAELEALRVRNQEVAPPISTGHPITAVADSQIDNQIQCSIFGMDKRLLRRFQGSLCVFFPDGRYARFNGLNLEFHGPSGELQWSKPLSLNHQLNADLSETRLLTLASEVHSFRGKDVRFDAVYAIGLDGKTLGRFSLFDHWKEIERRVSPSVRGTLYPCSLPVPGYAGRTLYEATHANSVYQIPANVSALADPAFQAGNFIVNAIAINLTFVLDREMKKILWSSPLDRFGSYWAHDVQVLPNGHLLIYENRPRPGLNRFSSFYEYDLKAASVVQRWETVPAADFYSLREGGAQLLDNGHLLYNDSAQGIAREITRDGQVVWEVANYLDSPPGHPKSFQQIKRYDLSEFLANNHVLSSFPEPGSQDVLKADPPRLSNPEAVDETGGKSFRPGGSVLIRGTGLLGGSTRTFSSAGELKEINASMDTELITIDGNRTQILYASDREVRFRIPDPVSAGEAAVHVFNDGRLIAVTQLTVVRP